jgi:hypothetical protein
MFASRPLSTGRFACQAAQAKLAAVRELGAAAQGPSRRRQAADTERRSSQRWRLLRRLLAEIS